MSAEIATFSSSTAAAPIALQRARGRARVTLGLTADGATRLVELFQEGALKTRVLHPTANGELDVVLINTAGGLTGGDQLSVDVTLTERARATLTTPGCERIYRSSGEHARVEQRLRVGRGARLDWLPQETILYDQGRLQRRLDVELDADAEVTLGEAILFGRTAMGEHVKRGHLSDRWTIRRAGRLMFADAIRMVDRFESSTACPTTLRSNCAMASIVHVGRDIEAKRDALRALFSRVEGAIAGTSAIHEVLVSRVVAPDGRLLRQCVIPALSVLRDGRPLPRNWLC